MTNNKNVFSQGAKQNKSTPTEDINTRAARYNYIKMQKDTQSAKEGFAERLASLRSQKGESAREMSLSLGQGPGYISNIENGYSWPWRLMRIVINLLVKKYRIATGQLNSAKL